MKSLPERAASILSATHHGEYTWTCSLARNAEASLWTEWDELNQRINGGHPLLDSRFIRPLLDSFGTGDERLLSCRQGTGLVGAAILVRKAAGLWQTFLPSQAPLGPVLFPDEAVALRSVRQLAAFPTPLSIDFLCQDPLFSPFSHAGPANRVVIAHYAQTMAISMNDGFAAYWHARSQNLRKNVSRYLRRAERAGLGIELERITTPAGIVPAVDRYGELEGRGWKGREGTAIRPGTSQGRFYTAVMQGFATSGNAEVYEMRMGGRLAASRLVIGNADFRVILKTTYDEDLRDYAPGRLLLHHLLERVSSGPGPRRVEFYTKATADQMAWATDHRTIFHARGFRWDWLLGAYRAANRLRRSNAVPPRRKADSDTARA